MSAYTWCKDGCVQPGPDKGYAHRTPIDCVTADELWASNDKLRDEIKCLNVIIDRLKVRIYDLEHDDNE